MSRYSDFEKLPRDKYYTPLEAFKPLIAFLPDTPFGFAEPCAGNGKLIKHIESNTLGECVWASDIDPDEDSEEDIEILDGLSLTAEHVSHADLIITNPPWSRQKKDGYILHRLIEVCANLKPTWFLVDSNWVNTIQSKPFVDKYLTDILPIGRVKWFGDMQGKEDASWYRFDKNKTSPTVFLGRQ